MKKHRVKLETAPDPSTGPEAPPEEIIPIPIWRTFEDKPINECIANMRCEGNRIQHFYRQILTHAP